MSLPEVVLHHRRGDDEHRDDRARAVCATCGWRGGWRLSRGGWTHRDYYWHRADAYKIAMDAVWDGRARPAALVAANH